MERRTAGWFVILVFGLGSAGPVAAEVVSYSLVARAGLGDLRKVYTPSQLALLEKLNRADLEHLVRQPQLVVPNQWDADELAYSPLPSPYAAMADLPKGLVVDQAHQVFGAYEHGTLVRWGPVSTGRRRSPTPPGLYSLNWRSPGRHSTVDPDWFMRWYFNFDNRRGLSLHQYELPGLPESHACVRLLERDALWLYEWGQGWQLDATAERVVEAGTPLWIVGTYAYDKPKPWLEPANANPSVTLPESAAQARPIASTAQ